MNLVYFIDHLRPDGTQFVLRQLVDGLAARGHTQAVFCLNDSWDDVLVKRLRAAGADVHIVGKLPLALGFGLLNTFWVLRRRHFDVAVTLLFVSDVIGRPLAHFAGVRRVVTSIQTHDQFYRGWQRWLVRRTIRWADVALLNSQHIREFAIKQEGINPDKIHVIYNSIEAQNYQHPIPRASLHGEFNLPANAILIGSVGRLTYQKGFDVFLSALAQIKRQELHWLIAGAGEEEPKLRALATTLGLGQRVHFAGYRRDIPQLLGALDLYVHPSRFEGMPIAVLEAMAAGCGIVATAVDGTQELIEDGVHGWLAPPEDASALANVVQMALSDPEEARRRGSAARQRVLTEFGVEAMITAWENILLKRV